MDERYKTITSLKDPIIIAEHMEKARLGELVKLDDGRSGEVLSLENGLAVIQIFEGTDGLGKEAGIELTGSAYRTYLSEDILGRIFDGKGMPLDGGPPILSGKKRPIEGVPMNPSKRSHPERFIETGLTAIDLLNSLVAGQKLPIFSMSGLPHNELAAQIITQADVEDIVVMFCGLGLTHDDYDFFRFNAITEETRKRTVMFMNLASDPTIERLITPRLVLTHAEYLAFEKGHNVLFVLSDMRN